MVTTGVLARALLRIATGGQSVVCVVRGKHAATLRIQDGRLVALELPEILPLGEVVQDLFPHVGIVYEASSRVGSDYLRRGLSDAELALALDRQIEGRLQEILGWQNVSVDFSVPRTSIRSGNGVSLVEHVVRLASVAPVADDLRTRSWRLTSHGSQCLAQMHLLAVEALLAQRLTSLSLGADLVRIDSSDSDVLLRLLSRWRYLGLVHESHRDTSDGRYSRLVTVRREMRGDRQPTREARRSWVSAAHPDKFDSRFAGTAAGLLRTALAR